jgi:RNA polymerase sigma-70 factor, ECF subfamily
VNRRPPVSRARLGRDRTLPDADAEEVRAAVRAVRRGDRDAFARIVTLYQRRVFGLALMMTRDPSGAEDIAQDAFVRAFVHLAAYDEGRPFYPWISTIVVRLAQNWLVRRARTRAREDVGIEVDPDRTSAHAAVDPLDDLIADESERALWREVAALPAGERTAVILYYRQNMSVRDIAHALGVTGGTVKTLLFRARQRLRRTLGNLTPAEHST